MAWSCSGKEAKEATPHLPSSQHLLVVNDLCRAATSRRNGKAESSLHLNGGLYSLSHPLPQVPRSKAPDVLHVPTLLRLKRVSVGAMEPVSLTLGIVPILGGSVKLYKSAHSKLKIARHFSREVDRIRRQFDRQKQFFLNEMRLLLRLVLDDESLIQEMVDDGAHEKWQSPFLNRALRDRLGDNCSVLEEVAEDVTKTINDAEEGLKCFDWLEAVREKVGFPFPEEAGARR